MSFASLDSTKLLALMAAGGVFALAGLWLMFRPKTDGHSAKIEIFGLKFESSSAGLLVFVVGAAFLASPLFVQERKANEVAVAADGIAAANGSPSGVAAPRTTATGAAEAADAQVRTTTAQPTVVSTTSPRALTAVGEEIEPNDNIAEANEIPVGSVIQGEVSADNVDFYTFTFPEGYVGRFTVNVSGDPGFDIYDDLGGRFIKNFYDRRYSREVDGTRYYVSVGTRERRAGYTLPVAAREE